MDSVATISLKDFGRQPNLGVSAADLFNTAMKGNEEKPETPEGDTPQNDENLGKSASELFESGVPQRTAVGSLPATPQAPQTPADPANPAGTPPPEGQQPAKPAVGRPSEKLSDQTKSDILALIENGKLEGFEDGKYETRKDLEDLLEANRGRWQEEADKTVREQFFQNLPPGLQFVAQYAANVQHPSELIPYLTAIDNYSYMAQLNPEDPNHQAEIVRQSNAIRGIPEQESEADIKFLHENNKLADRAKALKPSLDKFAGDHVVRMQQQQQVEMQRQAAEWNAYLNDVKTSIDVPVLDGIKLKPDHKDLVMQVLTQRTQGGEILLYSVIDSLLERREFDTLAQIALLGLEKKAYKNYIQTSQKAEDASSTIRELKSRDRGSSSIVPIAEDDKPAGRLQRPSNSISALGRLGGKQ